MRGRLAWTIPAGVVIVLTWSACGAAEELAESPSRPDEPTPRGQAAAAPESATAPYAFQAEVGLPERATHVADVRVELEPVWTLTGCLRSLESECSERRTHRLDARDRATLRELLRELESPRLCEPEVFSPGDPAYSLRRADPATPDDRGDWVFDGHLPRDPDAIEGRLAGECREASRLAWWVAQRVIALEEPTRASAEDVDGFLAAYTAFSTQSRERHPDADVAPPSPGARVGTLRFDEAQLPGLHAFHAARERQVVTRGYAHPGGAVVVVPRALRAALSAGHPVSGPASELTPFLVAAGVDAAEVSHGRLSGPLRHLFHFGNVSRVCPVAREEGHVLVRFELTVADRPPRPSRPGVVPLSRSRITLRFDPGNLTTELVAEPGARCEDE